MFKSLSFFFRYFLFWLVFFALNRVVFEVWNFSKFQDISLLEISKTFIYGMHMDASMAGYIAVIPFLVYLFCLFFPKVEYPKVFFKYYTVVLIFITSLITCVDFNIYTEWGNKINDKVVEAFLNTPKESLASAGSSPVYVVLSILFILFFVGCVIFRNLSLNKLNINTKTSIINKILLTVFVLSINFLAIRGGYKIAPMNPSQVYFSETPILNHSAINSNWLLFSTLIKKSNKKNPFIYYNDIDLKSKIDSINSYQPDSSLKILNTTKPNIIVVIMESFTADVVEELNGEKGITPAFSKLIKEGILFNNIYSSSDRTDKGLIAVLSAFPSQANRSIIKDNNKQEKLPSLMGKLANNGYHTSFFYGGYTEFANFKSYLLSHKIQTLEDASNYDFKDLTSKWGAYDEINFSKNYHFLKTEKQPFFSVNLTLSNHEPFELPTPGKFGDNSIANKFRSTSYYTAQCLYDFINNCKKENWYNNTLFIVVADHGHRMPKETNDIYVNARYHIPLLFLGGALKNEFKGSINNKFGGQIDIAATLFNQINLDYSDFKYSKDLLNKNNKGFAFYCWENGFGLVDSTAAVTFDPISKKIIYKKPDTANVEQNLEKAKAMMQSVYQDYLSY